MSEIPKEDIGSLFTPEVTKNDTGPNIQKIKADTAENIRNIDSPFYQETDRKLLMGIIPNLKRVLLSGKGGERYQTEIYLATSARPLRHLVDGVRLGSGITEKPKQEFLQVSSFSDHRYQLMIERVQEIISKSQPPYIIFDDYSQATQGEYIEFGDHGKMLISTADITMAAFKKAFFLKSLSKAKGSKEDIHKLIEYENINPPDQLELEILKLTAQIRMHENSVRRLEIEGNQAASQSRIKSAQEEIANMEKRVSELFQKAAITKKDLLGISIEGLGDLIKEAHHSVDSCTDYFAFIGGFEAAGSSGGCLTKFNGRDDFSIMIGIIDSHPFGVSGGFSFRGMNDSKSKHLFTRTKKNPDSKYEKGVPGGDTSERRKLAKILFQEGKSLAESDQHGPDFYPPRF